MRTLIILTIGFALLGAVLVVARRVGGQARAAAGLLFVVLWGLACAGHAVVGVRAGYPVALELAVFAVTFGLPAGVARRSLF